MLWLGVHLPLLPLEVFLAAGSAPDGAGASSSDEAPPRVVVGERGRILLRNTAAADIGIAQGSTLATAHSILPGLTHYRRDPHREQQRLALLAEILYGFSARVSLAPPATADDPGSGVVLEIGASLKLFGDAAELAQRVAAVCRDTGHQVRLRWASTPLAALVLARSEARSLEQVPLAQAAVEPCLSAERIERCANMGVHTLGQLIGLRRGLARRFGEDLVDFLARLTGERPDPRPMLRPAEHFRSTLHLLEPLNSKEAVTFPMRRLLTELQHWLVVRQLGAERLHWHFTGSGGEAQGQAMPVRFTRAQQSREAFLDISRLQLTATALPEDVISLTLETRRLVPWAASSRSTNLFGTLPGLQSGEDTEDLGELVDQLRARLGADACYSLEAEDQHTPEQAWQRSHPLRAPRSQLLRASRSQPLRASRSQLLRASRSQPLRPQPLHPPRSAGEVATFRQRPLWLFDPPRPVDRRQLELLRGPERIHTGWWLTGSGEAPAGQARDYYVARHRSGARCWVFSDPLERWFLHGYFA